MPSGPPYAPTGAGLGGVPSTKLDVPVTAVFMALFMIGAASHMTILKKNNKRGHKFLMSGMMFGFCMARITTCVMRIVWAFRPASVRIAIAAQIFVAAGVVLLFVINAIFAQRVLRAAHPTVGWHPAFSLFFKGIYVLIVVSLLMLIGLVVTSFYTLDSGLKMDAHYVQLYGQSVFLTVAFLPIPLVLGALIVPRSRAHVDKFGIGRFRSKIAILLFSATLLSLGAGFRLGQNASGPKPRDSPPWYDSKACFYIFNFTIEIIIIILYIVVRVDKRFHIPNGSRVHGDYSGSAALEGSTKATRVLSEEEVFDDARGPDPVAEIDAMEAGMSERKPGS